jgi:hypothetical protein
VSSAAEEIAKLVFQLVLTATSTATLGIPISPQIPNLLKKQQKKLINKKILLKSGSQLYFQGFLLFPDISLL